MGENLAVGGRKAVRTPMQWTNDVNGGFSNAKPSKLAAAVVNDGFGPEHVNAAEARHDPDSLLQFIRLLIERYQASIEIGWGDFALLDQPHSAVLAHSVSTDDERMIALHNFSQNPTTVPLVLEDCTDETRLVELLGEGELRPGADGGVELTLDAYGYRWLRVVQPDDKRLS